MEEDHKTLGEQQLESQQRAYELGLRYGYIDARVARPGMVTTSAQMGLSGRVAELYDQGHRESYDRYMASLNEPGHHLSVPGPMPDERIMVTSAGKTFVNAGGVLVVMATGPDGVARSYPADVVRVVR